MEALGITNLNDSEIKNKTKVELTKIAKFYKLKGYSILNKDELVEFILKFKETKKVKSPPKPKSPSPKPKSPSPKKVFTTDELNAKTKTELQQILVNLGIKKGTSKFTKIQLIDLIRKNVAKKPSVEVVKEVEERIISPRIIEKSAPRPREDIEKIFSTMELKKKTVKELQGYARTLGIKGISDLKKNELIQKLKNKTIKLIATTVDEDDKKYIKKIGPESNKQKYGLVKVLGQGKYGKTYEAINLDRKEGENEKYAVKVLQNYGNNLNSYLKEVSCLKESQEICRESNILCFNDSFIFQNNKRKPEYVIVSELLDNYKTLMDFLANSRYKPYGITKNQALDIYDQIVLAKNAFTKLCIHHSDLHLGNIMIDPQTFKIKVIDLGLCRTPAEEERELGGRLSDNYKKYSDDGRLNAIRMFLYNSSHGANSILNPTGDKHDTFFKSITKKIKKPIPGCKRVPK
jgi:hypothetical protein